MQDDKTNKPIMALVKLALEEDLGTGDVTVNALIPNDLKGVGRIMAKQEGIMAGLEPAKRVFEHVDPSLTIKTFVADGDRIKPKDTLMEIHGSVGSLLKGERTALNFLQHLAGIASFTARFVEAVEGTSAKILDTRKTLPGFRLLEKAAVKAGGGTNHRTGLYDMVLIKDNHLAAMLKDGEPASVRKAVTRARETAPEGIRIQVEVGSLEAAMEAARCNADMVLLDNMTPAQMAGVVENYKKEFEKTRPLIEASGGIQLDTVREVAESGVDRISIGALTHSAPALDIAMYIDF